ncbi:MAG: MFS transporter [Ignavibacteriales bacterium]
MEEAESPDGGEVISKSAALKFVVLLGIVSLFGDMTYEGARSITGAYLSLLGARAAVVGFAAGFGEFVGYGLRLVSGYISDRTGRYWTITMVGYALNLLVVPMLALAGRWEIAVGLMIAERIGKALRTPARDAMLSHATKTMGRGWGFGLHEAMDQIGAASGPAAVALVLLYRSSYKQGFAILLIPALLALGALLLARMLFPNPRRFESNPAKIETAGLNKSFWIYLAAVAMIGAGYVDFPLIAFHLKKTALASDNGIPLLYTMAMGIDAVAALVFGRLYDRFGLRVLVLASLLSSLSTPLVFLGGFRSVIMGMLLWGIGMGAQESIMRAVIGDMVPANRRGSAYGLFYAGYGLFWFLGSLVAGLVYDVSLLWLAFISMGLQVASIPLLLWTGRTARLGHGEA